VLSVLGLIGSVLLNAFAFDKDDAYGEVPIPGAASLHLPAGEVTITFHTRMVGTSDGGGLPIPELEIGIDPPPGVPEPRVTESFGGTTSVNSDVRRRVWIADVAVDGNHNTNHLPGDEINGPEALLHRRRRGHPDVLSPRRVTSASRRTPTTCRPPSS
jgi:hypothetical protein